MIVAGNTSPHALPNLNLQTHAEILPKAFIGRFLLRVARPPNREMLKRLIPGTLSYG